MLIYVVAPGFQKVFTICADDELELEPEIVVKGTTSYQRYKLDEGYLVVRSECVVARHLVSEPVAEEGAEV